MTLDGARAAARARAGEIALGQDPAAEAKASRRLRALAAPGEEWTVAQLLAAYLAARSASLSPTTARAYRSLAKILEGSQLGARPSRDVVRGEVRETIARIARKTPAQAWRVLCLLRSAYRWAQDEEMLVVLPDGSRVVRGRVDRDPTRRVEDELPSVRASSVVQRQRVLSDDEIKQLWLGVETLGAERAALARLILLCGTRRGETAAARWADLDLTSVAPAWTIPAEVRKGRQAGSRGARRGIVVPLAPLAVDLLVGLQETAGRRARVFGPLSISRVGLQIQRASGLPDATIHDLRRTCASGLQRLGAPPHMISVVLGHAREAGATATDAAYAHDRRAGEHRLWLERWARHVEGLVGVGREPGRVVSIAG